MDAQKTVDAGLDAIKAIGGIFAGDYVSLILKLVLLVSLPLGLWLISWMVKKFMHNWRVQLADEQSNADEKRDTENAHNQNGKENAQAGSDHAASNAAKPKP